MRSSHPWGFLLCLMFLSSTIHADGSEPSAQTNTTAAVTFSKLPLTFEPNLGQGPGAAEYLTRSGSMQAGVSGTGLRIRLRSGQKPVDLAMTLAGAKEHAAASPSEKTGGEANYLLGADPSKWKTHIPLYGRVRYNDVYPGIDLVFYGNNGHLEHDFVVQPGSDYRSIRIRFDGAKTVGLSKDGDLAVGVETGTLVLHAPVVYQERDGERLMRSGHFVLGKDGVSFAVDGYDPTLRLIIDPVLDFATYLANQNLTVKSAAVDSAGNTYIVGQTFESTYPVTAGAFQTTCTACAAQKPEIFITKLNPTGTVQVYSTFLGGSSYNEGDGITVDATGDAIVVGYTTSPDFPLKNAVASGTPSPSNTGFVTSLAVDGASLNFSSLLGGNSTQQAGDTYLQGVAADVSGNIYVSGVTESPYIPQTSGALNAGTPSYGNAYVFLTKLQPSGSLGYGAVLGSTGQASNCCSVVGVAVDSSGDAYLAGSVASNSVSPTSTAPAWPTTPGVYQTQLITAGQAAPFAAEVSPDGSKFVYSTLVTTGVATAMALTQTQEMLIVGTPFSGYPTTGDAFDTAPSQSFIAKLSADGTQLLYSSYFGTATGIGNVILANVTTDSAGDVWLAGNDRQPQNVPLVHPLQSLPGDTITPIQTAFVSEFDPAIQNLLFSTYFNGNQGGSLAAGLGVDSQGRAHFVGTGMDDVPTTSSAFLGSVTPPPSGYSYQFGFAALMDPAAPGPGICFPENINYVATLGSSLQEPLAVTNCGTAPLTISAIQISGSAFTMPSAQPCQVTLAVGAACSLPITFTPSTAQSSFGTLAFSSNATVANTILPIQGTAVMQQGPAVTLSKSSVDFGSVNVGFSSSEQLLQVMNVGIGTLMVSSITASGDFSQTNDCNAGVLGNEECTVYLTFTPTAMGTRTGTLTISSNAPGSPQTIPLSGTGASVLSIAPQTPTLTLVSAGGSATSVIQVSGQNGFSGGAALSCNVKFQGSGAVNAPPTCSLSPAQVQVTSGAMATSTLTVSTPTASASTETRREAPWSLAALLFVWAVPFRRRREGMLLSLIGVVLAGCLLGCGGGGSASSTPPPNNAGSTVGAYQVTVTATSGAVTSSATVAVNVK